MEKPSPIRTIGGKRLLRQAAARLSQYAEVFPRAFLFGGRFRQIKAAFNAVKARFHPVHTPGHGCHVSLDRCEIGLDRGHISPQIIKPFTMPRQHVLNPLEMLKQQFVCDVLRHRLHPLRRTTRLTRTANPVKLLKYSNSHGPRALRPTH